MSTIKSSTEHLTLNADGASKDIKFQANGVEKASISSAGAFTSTSIDATKLSGALPAISGAALTGVGKVLQVVQGSSSSRTDTTSTSDVTTNLKATITPSASTSKILCIVYGHIGSDSSSDGRRGVFNVYQAGSISNQSLTMRVTSNYALGISMNYLHSPNTTSATEYDLRFRSITGGNIAFLQEGNYAHMTLIEVGA